MKAVNSILSSPDASVQNIASVSASRALCNIMSPKDACSFNIEFHQCTTQMNLSWDTYIGRQIDYTVDYYYR